MSTLTRFSRVAGATLLMAAAATLSACSLQISNQAEARSDWKKEYTLAPGGTLEIRNTNGLIEVDPSDGNQVSVTAERIAKAGTDAAAREAAEAIEIKETASANSIVLDAKMAMTGLFISERQVKFHVRAPKGTVLRLANTNGAIDVRDMAGEMRLDTTNGRVKGVNLAGPARAETTNGTVDLDFATVPDGGITAETTNGAVIITLPKDAKVRINARVTNGGIVTENLPLEVSEQSRRRLTATMNGGGPEVRLETTNGGVRIRVK